MPVLQPEKTKPQKKPQARGFNPHAMAQAQALNQQPDSIPAMMKPGEYVLPPDTVAAMGGPQALDATVAQTHTPANAGAIVPKGFEPRLFFSGGGLAEEEEQKPISPANIYPQGSPSAGANVYGGAIDATKSAVSAAANPQGGQPLVKGAAQMFGQRQELQQQGRERWDASVAARQPAPAQPVGLPGAASASPSAAPAVTSGFASSQDGMANDFGRQQSSPTPMASAAPSIAPKTPASDPQSRINEQMANAQRQRAEGIAAVQRGQAYDSITQQQRQQAYDTWQSKKEPWFMPTPQHDTRLQTAEKTYTDILAGRSASATPGVSASGPSTNAIGSGATPERTPEQLAKQLGGLDRQHAQNVQLQAVGRTPEQARAEAAEQPTGQQVPGLSGVYQHGRGQYSDNAQGMGFTPGFTGQPSAQNIAASDAIAQRSQAESLGRVLTGAQQVQQPMATIQRASSYDPARERERKALVSALTSVVPGARGLTAAQRNGMLQLQNQEAQQAQAKENADVGFQQSQMQNATQREISAMREAGETGRSNARNAIDQGRLGLDREVRGFDIRQAQRKQSFQEAWEKGTKEQREQLQQMYPDLMPTDKEKPRFEVVRGRNNPMTGESGQDYVLRMNPNGTVEQVPVDGMAQSKPQTIPKNKGERVVGSLYVDNNGQLVRWTEKGAVSAQ